MSRKRQSLLWELSHPDQDYSSFLYGTIHVRDRQAFFRSDEVIDKMRGCDAFASEVDLDELTSQGMPDYFFLSEKDSLQNRLGAHHFARGQSILKKTFDVDLFQYDRLLPFLTINAISLECLNSEEPMPLDLHLWSVAKSMGLETAGLETVEDQANLLKEMPLDWQFHQLKDLLKNAKAFRKSVIKMLSCYVDQDTMKLYQLAKSKMGAVKAKLIYHRNEKMVDRFVQIHSKRSLLAAVGAGHFSGKYGLIAMLKKKGFKLTAR